MFHTVQNIMVKIFFSDLFDFKNLNRINIAIIYLLTYEFGTSFVILKIFLIKTYQSLSGFHMHINYLLFIV